MADHGGVQNHNNSWILFRFHRVFETSEDVGPVTAYYAAVHLALHCAALTLTFDPLTFDPLSWKSAHQLLQPWGSSTSISILLGRCGFEFGACTGQTDR